MRTRVLFLSFLFLVNFSCKKEKEPRPEEPAVNKAPSIQSINANPDNMLPNTLTKLNCVCTDPEGDPLTYSWSSLKGTFPYGANGASVSWVAPLKAGTYVISINVNDGQNVTSGTIDIIVGMPTGAIIDTRDGKSYKTVMIGSQTWMAENIAFDTGSGCWAFNNLKINLDKYGWLYNWASAQKACPSGWHLPSDAEWSKLEVYLQNNGFNYDGVETTGNDRTTHNRIAKAMATAEGWSSSTHTGVVGNTDYPEYRNISGFSALPGGYYNLTNKAFIDLGLHAHWWSSTESSTTRGWLRHLSFSRADCDKYNFGKEHAFSVRCVKNN